MNQEKQEILIARPDTETLQTEVHDLVAAAEALQIKNVDDHSFALETIKQLRQKEKRITDHFEPARKAADGAKKEILAARDLLVKPLSEARGFLDRKAVAYQQDQQRIAREAELKAQEEVRKEEERRLAEADKAIEEGDDEKAEAILDAPVVPAAAPIAPEVATVSGVSTRTTWSAEVVDMTALIQHAAKNPLDARLIEPNMTELNKLAVVHKEKLDIPGVKAVPKTTTVARG